MARQYSGKHGKHGSKKPVNKAKPTWVSYADKEIEQLVVKLAKAGKIKRVIIASNCPQNLYSSMPENITKEKFAGDETMLGTKLGKPFPVAMVGYE